MSNYLKDHLGPVVFGVALFIVGLIFGLFIRPNANGLYIDVKSPIGDISGGKPTIDFRNTDLAIFSAADSAILLDKFEKLPLENEIRRQLREMVIKDIDLTIIGETDSTILVNKLGMLPVKNPISEKLRVMAKDSTGPFARIPVNITLRFTTEENISGPVAKACRNTPVFGVPVILLDFKPNAGYPHQRNGILSIQPYREELSDCSSGDSDVYDVWVNRQHIEGWLGTIDEKEANLAVKANIVVNSGD